MPVVTGGELLGAIVVAATRPGVLAPAGAAALGEMASDAGMAIVQARASAHTRQIDACCLTAQLAPGIARHVNTPLAVVLSNLSVLQTYEAKLRAFAAASSVAVRLLRTGEAPAAVADALEDNMCSMDVEYIVEDWPHLAAESTAAARRIDMVISDVAAFARGNSEEFTLLDLGEVLEGAVAFAWMELGHSVRVGREFCSTSLVVSRQRCDLTQAFKHLLLNAGQALDGRAGGITLTLSRTGGDADVGIHDDGAGIER